MREARVFAPGHLTGLFQICDQASDPINKGARGAGISITRGTTTLVRVTPAEKTVFSIQINREIVEDAFVSEKVVRSFLRYQLTAYPFSDPRLHEQMKRLLSLDEVRSLFI